MKKKFTTKWIAIVLSLAMCLSCMIIPSYAAGYTDVSDSSWYYEYVTYVTDKGYMNGVEAGKFDPEGTLTRGMFVTVLYRMSEDYGDYAGVDSGFSDVEVGAWFSDAIAWAVDKGITDGTSLTEFSPNSAVTREQMATFVARYLAAYDITLNEVDDPVSNFGDIDSVSFWALSSVETMRLTGIILGDNNGNFWPSDTATRAEAATIFYRLDMAIRELDTTPGGETDPEPEPSTDPEPDTDPDPDTAPDPDTDPDPDDDPNTYTITYYLPNGSIYTETVESGYTDMYVPTYENGGLLYEADEFLGWYTDEDYMNEFVGAVTEDITLYGKSVHNCTMNEVYITIHHDEFGYYKTETTEAYYEYNAVYETKNL